MLSLLPITPEMPGFAPILVQSVAEGERMLARFEANWRSGANRFDQRGEVILWLWRDGMLVGVCGRNVDPFDTFPRAGRVRPLYVEPASRRQGVGRILVETIVEGAAAYFDYLNTNAPDDAFAFYERLGFIRQVGLDHVTHRLVLGAPSGLPRKPSHAISG